MYSSAGHNPLIRARHSAHLAACSMIAESRWGTSPHRLLYLKRQIAKPPRLPDIEFAIVAG